MEDMVSLDEAKREIARLENYLYQLVNKLGFDCDNVLAGESSSPNERFVRDEIRKIANDAYRLSGEIKDLQKPVVVEDVIQSKENGRYALGGVELTSGFATEVLLEDSDGEPTWVKARVDHDGSDYYCRALGGSIPLDHLVERFR